MAQDLTAPDIDSETDEEWKKIAKESEQTIDRICKSLPEDWDAHVSLKDTQHIDHKEIGFVVNSPIRRQTIWFDDVSYDLWLPPLTWNFFLRFTSREPRPILTFSVWTIEWPGRESWLPNGTCSRFYTQLYMTIYNTRNVELFGELIIQILSEFWNESFNTDICDSILNCLMYKHFEKELQSLSEAMSEFFSDFEDYEEEYNDSELEEEYLRAKHHMMMEFHNYFDLWESLDRQDIEALIGK